MKTALSFTRKKVSICAKKHFQSFFTDCKKLDNDIVRIYYNKKYKELGRFGFITTKKLGNAVIRNRCRRRLKEIMRLNQLVINQSYDLVLVAKTRLMGYKFNQSQEKIIVLLKNNGLLVND